MIQVSKTLAVIFVLVAGLCCKKSKDASDNNPPPQVITVSTFAGSGWGYLDGIGTAAKFNWPSALIIDRSGSIYVADALNSKIRKILPSGMVSTLVTSEWIDGASGICLDKQGNFFVAETPANKILKVTPDGTVSIFAGSTLGYSEGTGASAQFAVPTAIIIDSDGNLFLTDYLNHKIRKINPAGLVTTLAGSASGYEDGNGIAAKFSNPRDICLDGEGNLYVADQGNHKIRKITSAGVVSTFAGSIQGFADGIGKDAKFDHPSGIFAGNKGSIYVADTWNHKIRMINAAGVVSTLAGSERGFNDGSGAEAKFNFPLGMCKDDLGNIYVADGDNHRIRKISFK